MDYALYLLVNANLFLRPAELAPDLEKLPLYHWFILACLLVSIPKLIGLLTPGTPLRHPVSLCVFGVFGFVALSHLAHSDLDRGAAEVFEFAKVVVYFVLFLALVSTPGKLRLLLAGVIVFGVITTSVAVLEYHQVIDLPNLKTVQDAYRDRQGEEVTLRRLMLTGVLHDPNEFCVFLGVLCILTVHRLTRPGAGVSRLMWLLPLGLFLYAINLTKSRGGLLALLVGLATMSVCKWGVRRTAVIGLFLLPLVGVGLAGRQTEISVSEGTGQTRLALWSDWLMRFRGSPILGESPAITPLTAEPKELRWNYQQLAHNSYLQAFADVGLIGGMLFLGAFVFAFRTMARHHGPHVNIADPEQRHLHPFVFGALAAYMTGMMSLSLCYVLPTYFIVALPVAFARMTVTEPRLETISFDSGAWRQLALASVGMLGFIYVFMKVFRA
ncbi:MAG: O-antigen ligase family protein [Gemmataceae bacterium]|nr:O-antigen ligase family protein [Gemmataceae bacterium]